VSGETNRSQGGQFFLVALVALLAAAGGYFVAMRLAERPAAVLPGASTAAPAAASLVGQRRPDFTLADAAGNAAAAADFDGQIVLLNFWATWCAPCVEEMPMLARLHDDLAGRGLQVVGIAVDEPARARSFADDLGLDYPLLFGQGEAMLVGRRYGNASGMLPYSVLIDAGGIVRWTHLGAVTREQLERQIAALP
jgi:peroxiredoxin